ncbi:hypothetical protein [Salipiger pallidus]|uniref:hypothetical protein n=1 Tax=Salipiger pallidus TaxID=1775170 RepID=UPI0016649114|nr:hypothetical protein [Salipiger pallidus]
MANFLQCNTIAPVGVKLLSVQGTSFVCFRAVLAADFAAKNDGGTQNDISPMIFVLCLAGCVIAAGPEPRHRQVGQLHHPDCDRHRPHRGRPVTVQASFPDLAGGAQTGDSLVERMSLAL